MTIYTIAEVNLYAIGEIRHGIDGKPKSIAVLSIGSGVGAGRRAYRKI
jgi:predicted NBD/HSP70 family sugar kinase